MLTPRFLVQLVAALLVLGLAVGEPPASAAPSSQSQPAQPYCDEYGYLVSAPCSEPTQEAQPTAQEG